MDALKAIGDPSRDSQAGKNGSFCANSRGPMTEFRKNW